MVHGTPNYMPRALLALLAGVGTQEEEARLRFVFTAQTDLESLLMAVVAKVSGAVAAALAEIASNEALSRHAKARLLHDYWSHLFVSSQSHDPAAAWAPVAAALDAALALDYAAFATSLASLVAPLSPDTLVRLGVAGRGE